MELDLDEEPITVENLLISLELIGKMTMAFLAMLIRSDKGNRFRKIVIWERERVLIIIKIFVIDVILRVTGQSLQSY